MVGNRTATCRSSWIQARPLRFRGHGRTQPALCRSLFLSAALVARYIDAVTVSMPVVQLNGVAVDGIVVNGFPRNGAHTLPPPSVHEQARLESTDKKGDSTAAPSNAVGWAPPDAELTVREDARLESMIAVAQERAKRANARAAARDAELRELARAELEAEEATIAEMQRDHEREMSAIYSRCRADADRILTEAREYAAERVGDDCAD